MFDNVVACTYLSKPLDQFWTSKGNEVQEAILLMCGSDKKKDSPNWDLGSMDKKGVELIVGVIGIVRDYDCLKWEVLESPSKFAIAL